MPQWAVNISASLCTGGLLIGTLFFAFSLTPSLVPRPSTMQGVLSGMSLAAGYGVGVFGRWLWSYMEMPVPRMRVQVILTAIAAALCLTVALIFLRQASEWQNSIRLLMEMDTVDTARPFLVGLIAAVVFGGLLAVTRLFHLTFRVISGRLHRIIPRRVSIVIGALLAVVVFWAVIDGVLLRFMMRAADTSFQQVDARMEPELAVPADPLRTGSEASLVAWQDLGRTGRNFVSYGPDAAAIGDFAGEPAVQPVRVYVGLNSAETTEARARLALEELLRVGAFDRSVLVIATPTGTGWIDRRAIDPLEYLHRGDIATVAVQYSYLPSWLSLLAEPEYGAQMASAVFAEIYRHWTRLPRDRRPQLYLYGLSLGALNSQRASDLYDVIADPFAGALWSGTPFRSERWRSVTNQREPSSPAWLPRFRDSSIVRFSNQFDGLRLPDAEWGPLRIVYLQYASDPVTFFEPQALYRQPEWMYPPRGPDVSPQLRWFPVVTMLQLAADVLAGDAAPMGYGHVYAAEHYIDAWLAITEPAGWSEADIQRLKELHRAAP
jgi:uncharacterized membrane protein